MIVVITDRPEMGSRERVCHNCGEIYVGSNFVRCLDCERNYAVTVVEAWR